MLQYILNTTAIWLISLVIFDLFLRRESYHGYNRFYLCATFLAGTLFPLWEWADDSIIYTTATRQPLEQLHKAKLTVVSGVSSQGESLSWQQWLMIIYITGALVMVCLLAADIIKLAAYYHAGSITHDHNWTIIETGKGHAPFSIFGFLFINSRQQYTAEEWAMIYAHEKRHTTLLHIADLTLIQLARIIFWFHPLVYIYNKRLLLVHEYQADNSATQPQQYGRFLVEQAILQSAPALSHSFNRSPIKNRLIMLTRTSSTASRAKMLLFIPLAAICLLCFSKNSFSQKFEKKGNIVTYRGNKFEMSQSKSETIVMINPQTGKEDSMIVEMLPRPIKMNNRKIFHADDFTSSMDSLKMGAPASHKAGLDNDGVKIYLLSNLKDEFNALPDGVYYLTVNYIVLDDKGKIAYYENGGISAVAPQGGKDLPMAKDIQDKITKKIHQLLNDAPAHKAAYVKGIAVPFIVDGISFMDKFTIKDHKVVAE